MATRRSHFARKVRLLLLATKAPHELEWVNDVAALFASPNPLMKVPTLLDGEIVVFDSDHIAAYVVHKLGQDEFKG